MTPTNMIIAGLALALALVTGALGLQTVRLATEQAAHKTTIADHATEISDQARLFSKSVEAVRSKETARVIALEGVIHEKSALLESAETDAAAARLSSDRMRDKLARIAAAARERGSNPGATPAGPPAEKAIVVLTDMLIGLDQRAGELAEFADRAHAAGQICEASYDAVRDSQ